MNKLLTLLLLLIIYSSCTQNSAKEKHQSNRNNIVNVREKVKEIPIEEVLLSNNCMLYLMNEYLIIEDYLSMDKLLHFFDRSNFNYVKSILDKGQGPNEITNIGNIGIDEVNRRFFVSDHGKQCILSYHLDSVLSDTSYEPTIKARMEQSQFPAWYQYINDTLSIGLIIQPIGNSDFKPSVGKWNMETGEIGLMEYEHPEIEKKRITFGVSMEHEMYVEAYNYYDLITICDLEGNLKYNIYGPKWNSNSRNRKNQTEYYTSISVGKDRIITLYSGENGYLEDGGSNLPDKFIIYDINGDYIETLEVDYLIRNFCYDEENHRIFMCLDDIMHFAYLDLTGV